MQPPRVLFLRCPGGIAVPVILQGRSTLFPDTIGGGWGVGDGQVHIFEQPPKVVLSRCPGGISVQDFFMELGSWSSRLSG